jgi:hypothetical protein
VIQLEPASFEVERFELAGDACLEVRGRWFGVRGRRFMRPTLTAVADGREQRLLAVLDHKPWIAEEGETWLAAFPCSTDPASLLQAELTVAPDVTVPLPPASAPGATRRRRAGSRRTPAREPAPAAIDADERVTAGKNAGEDTGALQLEHRAALQSRDEALAELGTVERDRERLRHDLREALAARDAAIAERHEVIETEVGLRIAELRAEAERERAAAGLAAQIARERDTAREERVEAIRERDEAHAERDASLRERNRMLAQRDTARTLALDATRQWEATAALGTRRTQERDSVAGERDRMTHERDAALEERERVIRDRDAALEELERVTRDRDVALKARERASGERDAAREERDRSASEREAAREERDRAAREREEALEQRERTLGEQPVGPTERAPTRPAVEAERASSERATGMAAFHPTQRRRAAAETGSAIRAPGSSGPTPIPRDTDLTPRPRTPPAPGPAETRVAHSDRAGRKAPSLMAHPGGPRDAAGVWRARLLAIAALLVVFVVLVVTLTAK